MELNEGFEKTITSGEVERWRYPRFFAGGNDEIITITGDDAKHIVSVLRMREGDRAVVCDGEKYERLCEICGSGKDYVTLRAIEKRENSTEPTLYLRLFQCMPKSDKMEFIVQKAVELGASEIIPVNSSRCVSRPDDKSAAKKIDRYQKIAYEAAKQCGRGIIPSVSAFTSFSQAVKGHNAETRGILFYECGGASLNEIAKGGLTSLDIFIGPEGGFTPEEAAQAEENGVVLATLGARILRTETAPLAAISVLMNLTGNM